MQKSISRPLHVFTFSLAEAPLLPGNDGLFKSIMARKSALPAASGGGIPALKKEVGTVALSIFLWQKYLGRRI